MTHDNGERPREPDRSDTPMFSPPLAAMILSVIVILVLLFALSNVAHKRKATNTAAVPPRPTVTVTAPSPAPSPSVTTNSPTPTTSARVSVRWRGILTLSGFGDYKDLDTVPPRKRQKGADVRGDSVDPTLNGFGDTQVASVGKRLLSAADCATAARAQGTDGTDPLEKGDVMCVATSAGHIARLQTIDFHMGTFVQVVRFRVVVWNPPTQPHR